MRTHPAGAWVRVGMQIVEQGFRALASARHARAFHPTGALFEGTVELTGEGPLPAGSQEVLVRLSKGAGLPFGLPDFLGLAFRVHGPRPVDVLCTTTLGTRGYRRLALAPARAWSGAGFSTLMPWEPTGGTGRRVYVVARVLTEGIGVSSPGAVRDHLPVEVRLRVVDEQDAALQEGLLRLTGPALVDPDDVELDPMRHHPAGWKVGPGWLARLRESAYVGSRRGRP